MRSCAALIVFLAAPEVPWAAGYVGSGVCASCHRETALGYAKSAMGRSLMPIPVELMDRLLPRPASVFSPRWQRTYEVRRDGSNTLQTMSQRGPEGSLLFTLSYPLRYVVGSGVNGYTFLVERDGFLFEAPLSYYTRPGRWDLSPGYEDADIGFNRRVDPACVACHAGRLDSGFAGTGRFKEKPFEEAAIACETCHGPGGEHVKGNTSAIVNPRKLEARRGEDICMRCHQDGHARVLLPGKTWDDFRPGEPLSQTLAILAAPGVPPTDQVLLQHHSAMKGSRCFQASQGRLSCFSCHTIHARSNYREACLACHAGSHSGAPSLQSGDCANCHMPKRSTQTISHAALTDHRIPRDSGQPPLLANTGSDFSALDPITAILAYGQLAARWPEALSRYRNILRANSARLAEDPRSAAALARDLMSRSTKEADAQASQLFLFASTAPPDARIWVDWAEVLTRLGRGAEALRTLEIGLSRASYEPALHKALALHKLSNGDGTGAHAVLRNYLAVFPEDAAARELASQLRESLR